MTVETTTAWLPATYWAPRGYEEGTNKRRYFPPVAILGCKLDKTVIEVHFDLLEEGYFHFGIHQVDNPVAVGAWKIVKFEILPNLRSLKQRRIITVQ